MIASVSITGFVRSTSRHPAYHASEGAVDTPKPARSDTAYPMSGVNTVHPGYIDGGCIAQYPDSCAVASTFAQDSQKSGYRALTSRRGSAPIH
jgi:hypothetical protein